MLHRSNKILRALPLVVKGKMPDNGKENGRHQEIRELTLPPQNVALSELL
jgi:hypothetical protein